MVIDLVARKQLQDVIDKEPLLTDFGIGIFEEGIKSSEQYKRTMEEERDILLKRTQQFVDTCSWLDRIDKIKKINTAVSSYTLKHMAEKYIGYITNGVFIAAALHKGFKYRIYKPSPNVFFNMSNKSINKL